MPVPNIPNSKQFSQAQLYRQLVMLGRDLDGYLEAWYVVIGLRVIARVPRMAAIGRRSTVQQHEEDGTEASPHAVWLVVGNVEIRSGLARLAC